MWRSVLASLLITSSALAQQQITGYEALKVVARRVSRAALGRVISVTGVDGDPQPTRWNILVVDRNAPGGVREIQVSNGQVLASGAPARAGVGATKGSTIDTSKLNLDSSGAFKVASYTADKSHVNFSFVSYTLRTNERGLPVWIVTLQDDNRRPLGTIHINANGGNVTRVEGMYHGSTMAQVAQDPVEHRRPPRRDVERTQPEDEYVDTGGGETAGDEDDGDENVVKANIKRMFHRTKEDAARMFHRVRRNFADFIAGE